jgi:hypothetical protein
MASVAQLTLDAYCKTHRIRMAGLTGRGVYREIRVETGWGSIGIQTAGSMLVQDGFALYNGALPHPSLQGTSCMYTGCLTGRGGHI